MGRTPRLIPAFAALVLLAGAVCTPSAAPTVESHLDAVVRAARSRRLHEAPYWRTLLHYKPRVGGWRSLVDDPRFFLSETGATEPWAELEATIRGVLSPDGGQAGSDGHPRCRFPARYEWLREQLGEMVGPLAPIECRALEEGLAQMGGEVAALVFPSAHMNGPSSMFGHTLLRIDAPYESALLAYAVNYAARIDPEDNALAYAVKGFFGGYPGYYSIMPYYEKVMEYGDMEQRDVWEYRLNLEPDEVRRMKLHAWELRGIYADYFFLDENCSYAILFLLEAARPSVDLTDRYGAWVTPIDTVEDVLDEGLLRERVFRPSPVRKIRHLASSLDAEGIRLARELLSGDAALSGVSRSSLSVPDRARVLTIAAEHEQLRYLQGEETQEEFQENFLKLLRARSELGLVPEATAPPPEPPAPETGHRSSRLAMGVGLRGEDPFLEMALRPAYHAILDPGAGYQEGSQINFLDVSGRYYLEASHLRLERLDIIDIVSLSRRDAFFHPISWRIRTGLETRPFGDDDDLVYALSGGGGFTWGLPAPALGYALLEGEVDAGSPYDSWVAVGGGGSAGWIGYLAGFWKLHVFGRAVWYGIGPAQPSLAAGLHQSFRLSRNHSVFLELERIADSGTQRTEGKLLWNLYF